MQDRQTDSSARVWSRSLLLIGVLFNARRCKGQRGGREGRGTIVIAAACSSGGLPRLRSPAVLLSYLKIYRSSCPTSSFQAPQWPPRSKIDRCRTSNVLINEEPSALRAICMQSGGRVTNGLIASQGTWALPLICFGLGGFD